jgi:hypothetical protein
MNSQRPGLRRVMGTAGLTLAMVLIQFLMVAAYSWSAASTAPRDLPVAITGPSTAVALASGKISDADPGAFTLIPAASVAAARADITSRVAYGAIIVGHTPQVLIASGGSPAVASVLTALADRLTGSSVTPRNVTNIVPAVTADASGGSFGLTVLMVMLTSLIAGAMLTLRVRHTGHRFAGLVGFAVAGGLIVAAVSHSWLGIIPGNFFVIASVIGLGELAVASGAAGLAQLGHLFGKRAHGLGLAYAVLMLIGNPFSGANSAPQMLPGAWGTIGQALPSGAVASLLRSVAYFDGARSAGQWTVLGIWAGVGSLLTLVARPRPAATGVHTGVHAATATRAHVDGDANGHVSVSLT